MLKLLCCHGSEPHTSHHFDFEPVCETGFFDIIRIYYIRRSKDVKVYQRRLIKNVSGFI